MFPRIHFLAVLIAASAGLVSCSGKAANFERLVQTQAGALGAGTPAESAVPDRDAKPQTSQRGMRALSLSAYRNPEHGISLRYPRNYSLEEGNVQERSYFLKRQEELDREQNGAKLLATVLVPADAYPNTTFEHGSLQLIIKDSSTQAGCRQAFAPEQADSRGVKEMEVQGVRFDGRETRSTTGGAIIVETRYTGASNGTCYNFLLMVAAGDGSEESTKLPDIAKIMKGLEKIISSVQFSRTPTVPTIRASETSARL